MPGGSTAAAVAASAAAAASASLRRSLLRRSLVRSIQSAAAAAATPASSTAATASAAAAAAAPVGAPSSYRPAVARRAFSTTSTAAAEGAATPPPPPPLFEDPRQAILAAALERVPEHGWTEDALAAGAAAVGFPAVAHGMFGRGAVELVEHFAAQVDRDWVAELDARKAELAALPSARERLKLAVQLRLRLLAPHLPQWPQALALCLLPPNLEGTATRLAALSDELCYIASCGPQAPPPPSSAAADPAEAGAGPASSSFSSSSLGQQPVDALDWYAQRATVGSVYVAAELFFLTDYSEDHSDTWAFLDRRLHDLDALSHAPRSVQEGVLALHTACSSLASAAASLAQPAVWAAVQRLPVNGALVGALQTALANVAAMAPPTVDPFRSPSGAAAAASAASTADFPAPSERDPYAAATTKTSTTVDGETKTKGQGKGQE